jgi:hypothetical protein
LERVILFSQRVETMQGLRVGSTVDDVRQAWPHLQAGYDDAGVYMWSDDERHISYLIDVDLFDIIGAPDDVALTPDVIPGEAPVKRLIFVPEA